MSEEKPKEPQSRLHQEVGWLAPDGKYYPCDFDDANRESMWHARKAREIVDFFMPDRPEMDDYLETQEFLVMKGWIRVDVKSLWIYRRPTKPQVDTLFDLYRMKPQFYLPTEEMRKCLSWCGMKFLSKPDDNRLDFELSIWDEGDEPLDLPNLKTPGRPK